MKTKIAVIASQRKVVARIDGCECAVHDYILKQTGVSVGMEIVGIKSTYKASAKCHPDDEFDEKVGAILASDRAREKYEYAFNRALEKARNECFKVIDLPFKGCW